MNYIRINSELHGFFINLCLYLYSFMITGQCQDADSAVFKCWFGVPEEQPKCGRFFVKNPCSDGYTCVQRYNKGLIPDIWTGCCPDGNGPCHKEIQKMDPNLQDAFAPECNSNGYFKPLQCRYWGCACVTPEGKKIDGKIFRWGENMSNKCDDDQVVQGEELDDIEKSDLLGGS